MAIYLDGIATGSIKYNESTMMKIGGVFKHITHQFGANLEINTGKQAHNFMVEFMKSVKRGKFSKGLLNSLKNEVLVGDQIKEIATNYVKADIDALMLWFTFDEVSGGEVVDRANGLVTATNENSVTTESVVPS